MAITLQDTLENAYLLATGKATLPDTGSAKYNRLLALSKKFYRDWQNEPGVDWNSLYQLVGAGTVTATDTFDLDTEILRVSQKPGDYVRVLCTDDNYSDFETVPASELYNNKYAKAVAHIGLTVKFSSAFTTTSQEYGGTIYVPAYIRLDDLTSVNDEILIDNPDWLANIVASQYVLTDAQLNYMYPDLLAQANNLMGAMKLANQSQTESYNTGTDMFSVGLSEIV